ncbi:helix-turn-helix domain-containing protein [Oceanicella sp. SM1341]|uniref:AraC family transcriptional regulator n=1 Tax=Oceanicella sp. SM1341 TaxID=1548889 RepID=UPI000E4DAC2C|nr:helix-turn-helix transcriptional regulator [Oceanicella sp. SM1341]
MERRARPPLPAPAPDAAGFPAGATVSEGRFRAGGPEEACALVSRIHALPEPFIGIGTRYSGAALSSRHKHARGQLTCPLTGMITVVTDRGSQVVPPGHALWIPPGTMHQVRVHGPVELRSIYVGADAALERAADCVVFRASELLKVLMEEVVRLQETGAGAEHFAAVVTLVKQEMRSAGRRELAMPMPKDRRLYRICQAILAEPGIALGKDDLARIGNVSRRTLTRLFRSELGMTCSEWRQQALLHEAMGRLATGASVTTVALDLGYESPSAFSAMFRRELGFCPRDFCQRDA